MLLEELTQERLVEQALPVPGHAAQLHLVHVGREGGVLGQDEQDDEQHVQVGGRPPGRRVQHVQQRQQQHLQITAGSSITY